MEVIHSSETLVTTYKMKMTVFWDVAPLDWWILTNISEEHTASIIRADYTS
jgi:hypothetical protein